MSGSYQESLDSILLGAEVPLPEGASADILAGATEEKGKEYEMSSS